MNAPVPVLATLFDRRADVVPLVRAALVKGVVYVPLADVPTAGRHTLQLWVGDQIVAAISAELAGASREGRYPMRVGPLDPAHVPELQALAAQAVGDAAPSSEAHFEDSTLASRREPDLEDRTIVDMPEDRTIATPSVHPLAEPAAEEPAAEEPAAEEDETLPPVVAATRPDLADLADFANHAADEDSVTLHHDGSSHGARVSWNLRAATKTKDPMCGRAISGGKYVLDSVIGSGAAGIVFKASHRDLGRTVAIKVLHPRYQDDQDLLRVFRTEARAASQLEHPNVARVYDYGQEPDGLVYIVMEYLSGYTLGSVLEARGRLAPARALDIMLQTCAGLSAAHERGIVHRDVKPDNLVLVPAQDDEGRPVEIVKVCDFGIAALGTARNAEGLPGGTPEYMAPEQPLGIATAAADVYACGIVLYEMLTGQVPFTDPKPYRILIKHQTDPARPPSAQVPDLPAGFDAVVLRALEKDPFRRFQSAREMRVELRKIADERS